MATAYKIKLSPDNTGVVPFKPLDQKTADRVSELLQENHDVHHIFFNSMGFHNHIVHQLLSHYGLGCPIDLIEKHYAYNASYQLPPIEADASTIDNLSNDDVWKSNLGKRDSYSAFLQFFAREIDQKGWENVLNEYVFSGSEKADDMLVRMFSSIIHPIIHLGFGVEFTQPAIIAEALAEAAVHDYELGDFLQSTEQAAKDNGRINTSMISILQQAHDDKTVSTAARMEDGFGTSGLLERAGKEMIKLASQWVASPDMLKEKTAEMIHATAYLTGASQMPPKKPKMDFFLIHCINASIFWPTFNSQTWLSTPNKVRLLEWKTRTDILIYALCNSPTLHLEDVTQYHPLKDQQAQWPDVLTRLFHDDKDGHAIKLGRALFNAEKVSVNFEDREWAVLKGDSIRKVGNMAADSLEDMAPGEIDWVRGAGFAKAWGSVPERS